MQLGAVKLRALPSLGSNFFPDSSNVSFSKPPIAKPAFRLKVRSAYLNRPEQAPYYRPEEPAPPSRYTAPPPPQYGSNAETPPPPTPPTHSPLFQSSTSPVQLNTPPPPPPSYVPPSSRSTQPPSSTGVGVTPAEPPTVSADFQGAAALGLPDLPAAAPRNPSMSRWRPGMQPPRIVSPPTSRPSSKVMEWLNPPPPPTELLQRVRFHLSDTCIMTIFFGDITKWHVDGQSDAIVAPANKKLNAGAAVDGVIHKAAGPRLLSACQRLPDVAPQGIKCEVGMAVTTQSFNLPVSRVIHAVGPVYEGRTSDPDLENTYKAVLAAAAREGVKYIVFPPLSCRIYGYPYAEGAEVAIRTLKQNCRGFLQIDIVIRNGDGYDAFVEEASKALEEVKDRQTVPMPPQQTY